MREPRGPLSIPVTNNFPLPWSVCLVLTCLATTCRTQASVAYVQVAMIAKAA